MKLTWLQKFKLRRFGKFKYRKNGVLWTYILIGDRK